jgi:hypothetical protein
MDLGQPPPDLAKVGAAGRGVAVDLDRARVRGLDEEFPHILHLLDPGAGRLPAGELDAASGIRTAASWVNKDAKRS